MSEVRLRFNGKEAQEQQESSDGDGNANYDPLLLDKKVTMATEGLEPFFTKILRQKTSKENALAMLSDQVMKLTAEVQELKNRP